MRSIQQRSGAAAVVRSAALPFDVWLLRRPEHRPGKLRTARCDFARAIFSLAALLLRLNLVADALVIHEHAVGHQRREEDGSARARRTTTWRALPRRPSFVAMRKKTEMRPMIPDPVCTPCVAKDSPIRLASAYNEFCMVAESTAFRHTVTSVRSEGDVEGHEPPCDERIDDGDLEHEHGHARGRHRNARME